MSYAELASVEQRLGLPLRRIASDIDQQFDMMLPVPADPSGKLFHAIRHAAIGGGKRLRPLLVCASADLFAVPRHYAIRAGMAVECVHVHSLIHDDLPCMDDDNWRRGKPTVHKQFDEATAVLAGDSLLALAFEILGNPETHPLGSVRAKLACELARAAGAAGMAGGQMLDLTAACTSDVDAITRLQRLKTGSLIVWSVEAGAIMGGASAEQRTSLRGYAQKIGLAFQIADDLLDAEGDERKVGKKLQKDAAQDKATFVTVLGVERARQQAEALVEQAVQHLHCFEARAGLLNDIATFAIRRDH